jgi:hypothetical protein
MAGDVILITGVGGFRGQRVAADLRLAGCTGPGADSHVSWAITGASATLGTCPFSVGGA